MSLLGKGPLPVTAPLGPEWGPLEKEMLATIDIEKLLAVERATVEKSR